MALLIRARRWARDLGALALFSVVVAELVAIVWSWPASWQPWYPFLRNFAVGTMFTFLIAGTAWTILPWLHEKSCQYEVWRNSAVLRWSTLLVVLLLSALIGCAIGSEVVALLKVYRLVRFRLAFYESVRTTVPITIIIGVVAAAFDRIRNRLRDTEMDKARLEKLAAQAQLASLASRVQPHFLFNTLNSISALIREDPEQAERTLERLCSLLRSSLDPQEAVPLSQELKLVGDYLEIQRTRWGERLRYQADLLTEPGLDPTVPPFSVQTVVENSLKHVAAHRPEGVAVRLSTLRSEGAVVVEVTDDGPGFDAASIHAGHGLDNLQGRLRALYGERARVEYLRGAGSMTVRLCVPVQ